MPWVANQNQVWGKWQTNLWTPLLPDLLQGHLQDLHPQQKHSLPNLRNARTPAAMTCQNPLHHRHFRPVNRSSSTFITTTKTLNPKKPKKLHYRKMEQNESQHPKSRWTLSWTLPATPMVPESLNDQLSGFCGNRAACSSHPQSPKSFTNPYCPPIIKRDATL